MDGMTTLSASLLLDEQGKVIDGNRDAEILLGSPLEEARKVPLEKLNPALYQVLKDLLEKARRGRGVENYAFAYKLGRRLTRLMASVTPYPLEALGSVGTLITVRGEAARHPAPPREAEEVSIPEAKGDLHGLLQLLPEPIFILDGEGNLVFANRSLCDLLGQEAEEVLGRPLSFFLGRGHPPGTVERLLEASLLSPWRGELQLQRADGNRVSLRATCSLFPLRGEGGDRFLFLAWDCGDEVRLRREREGEIRRLWGLLDATGLAFIAFTPDRRITAFNGMAEEVLGVSREVAIGSLLEEVWPGDKEALAEAIEAASEGEVVPFILTLPGKADGREATYQCTARRVEGGESRAPETVILMDPRTGEGEWHGREAPSAEGWWGERFYSRCLENILRGGDEATFLADSLRVFEEEGLAEAGVVFLVAEGSLREVAAYGLDLREREKLAGLQLREGAVNLWTFSPYLEITFRAGIPRRGWEEALTMFEEPGCLSWLAGERRWKRLAVFPVGRKEAGAFLIFGEPRIDPKGFLPMVEALADARTRAESLRGKEKDGRRPTLRGEQGPGVRVARAEQERPAREPHGLTLLQTGGERSAPGGGTSQEHPRPSPGACRHEELLSKAREAKGEESVEGLPLWKDDPPSRSTNSLDLDEFSKRIRKRLQDHYGPAVLFEIEEDLPHVYLDGRVLEELVLGLVEDAVEASPPWTPVVLGMERWGDEVLLRVEDQGACIGFTTEGENGFGTPAPRPEDMGGPATLRPGSRETRLRIYEEMAKKIRGSLTWKGNPGEGNVVYLRIGIIPFLGRAEA